MSHSAASRGVTPLSWRPVSSTRVVSGTRNHALPNGITIPAWELLPRPAAKQPSVPCTGVWLSEPTTTVPGRTNPLRTPT